jgi:hypothetical protein
LAFFGTETNSSPRQRKNHGMVLMDHKKIIKQQCRLKGKFASRAITPSCSAFRPNQKHFWQFFSPSPGVFSSLFLIEMIVLVFVFVLLSVHKIPIMLTPETCRTKTSAHSCKLSTCPDPIKLQAAFRFVARDDGCRADFILDRKREYKQLQCSFLQELESCPASYLLRQLCSDTELTDYGW